MLRRFWTYEEAAIFVSKMRSEGYYAEFVHEYVSMLWGPVPVGGCAVWISEEAADEGEEVPDCEVKGPRLPSVISSMVGLLMVGVPSLGLILFVLAVLKHGSDYPGEAIGVLLGVLLPPALFLSFAAVMGVIMTLWMEAYRDPEHSMHWPARALHFIAALVLLFACTPLGGIVISAIVGLSY